MQTLRHAIVLALALIAGPGYAQTPPTAVKAFDPNPAIYGLAVFDAPEPPSAVSPAAANPAPALKQDVEPYPTKNEAAIKPVSTSSPPAANENPLQLGQATAPAAIFAQGPVPLSSSGEPGDTQVIFGAWFTRNNGSNVKIGEYQGLSSSPFWVLDGLYSNGSQTLGFYGNQTDNDSNQANARFFYSNFNNDFGYQRFLHRLDHIPLDNFTPSNPITDKTNFPANSVVLGKDLNVGQEYAIRVEELRNSTAWRINDNVRVRVDFWQMRKFGERQQNAAAHCFVASAGGSKNCHVLSQSQHIDWTTTEVTPRLEGTLGPLTMEYSRPMRQFSQDDQMIFRNYNNGSLTKPSSSGGMIWGDYPYGIVPETLTQIDQLKASLDLGPTRQFYAFGYLGNTENQDRDVHRDFNGADMRFTDWTVPRTSVTLYAKTYNQTGSRPTTLNASETQFLTLAQANAEIRTPIEFHRNTAGVKGNWRPDVGFGSLNDPTFTAGYEYDHLDRVNAIWQTPFLSSPGRPAGSQEEGIYSQADTATHTLFAGVRQPLGYHFNTFVRYKVHFVDNVLYGFRELSNVLNTALPQQQHIVEFGGGWYPASNFSLTLDQNIDVGRTYTDNTAAAEGNIVNFHEQSYATTLTMLYAPTSKLSLVTSFSVYSDWINQNMFLGDDYIDPEDPVPPKNAKMPLAIQPTYYAGKSELFNFNLNYKLTDNTRLTLGYQFVHGSNQFNMLSNPSFAFSPSLSTSEPKTPITFADLGQFSATRMDTNKVIAGIGWRIRPRATFNVYYNLFSYIDETNAANTGIAHQVNTSLTCIW